jgi:hypothetical protein
LTCVGNLWPASVYTWVWCLRCISGEDRNSRNGRNSDNSDRSGRDGIDWEVEQIKGMDNEETMSVTVELGMGVTMEDI